MDIYLAVGWLSTNVRVELWVGNKLENHQHVEGI